MKLPISFNKKPKSSSLHYLALILSSEKVSAVILEEKDCKLAITGGEHAFFRENLDDLSIDEVIETIESALTRAEEKLPPEIEIRKTVLGIKESWTEEESKKIKKDYLKKLKKICDALDLSPIGFMVVSEAIANLLQKEEGAPLSAVLVELGRKNITVSLFRGGKSVEKTEGRIELSRAATVNDLLKHFTVEVLPARIIIYDTDVSDDDAQAFISFQWSKSLPFLHMPQISVLTKNFDSRAVAYGAATQMGFEILDSSTKDVKTYNSDNLEFPDEKVIDSNMPVAMGTTEQDEVVSFGFVKDAEIEEVEKAPTISQDLGLKQEPTPFTPEFPVHTVNSLQTSYELGDRASYKLEQKEEISDEKKLLKKTSHLKMPSFKLSGFGSIWLRGIVVPILFIIVVLGGAYYVYFNHFKANVTVNLSAKNITEDVNVVFTGSNDSDFGGKIISAKAVETVLEGDMTVSATGKKEVGDKAGGTITIYNNNTGSDVKLSKGKEIKSENGLVFVMNNDVSVSSASGDVFSGTKPGTAKVDVRAESIGTNYNLPSGTKFSISGNSGLAAKNEDAFSGGSSKSVKVVSKDDLIKLKNDLIENLEKNSLEALKKKAGDDLILAPFVLESEIDGTKFDKNVGEEAKTVKLNAGLKLTGLAYTKTEIEEFAKYLIKENYGEENNLSADGLNIDVTDSEKKNSSEVSARLKISAALLPKIKKEEIERELSGKSRDRAGSILAKIPQIEKINIEFSPNLYVLGTMLPYLPKHVNLFLSTK